MRLQAAFDPIIIFLLGIGWILVKALQSRKKDAESWEQTVGPAQPPHVPSRNQGVPPRRIDQPGRSAVPPVARTSRDRLPQNKPPSPPPPPIVRTQPNPHPTVFAQEEAARALEQAVLKDSEESYARANKLQQAVTGPLSEIEKQTTKPRPSPLKPRARPATAAHILRTMRNPVTVRQAFLASFVLNPPKALE